MTRLFVSYARSDRDRIEELIASLREVGVQTWHDSELKGGQAWWDEILAAIAQCDVFLAMISPNYIKSKACQVERSYASALNRHLMPVKVADYPVQVLPIDLQGKQIIDYTTSNDRAAFKLIGALKQFETTPPLPPVMPRKPEPPFSYLTALGEQVRAPVLDHDEQRQIIDRLENGIASIDPDERAGAQEALSQFAARDDLYADVSRRTEVLTGEASAPTSTGSGLNSSPVGMGLEGQRRTLEWIERGLQSSRPEERAHALDGLYRLAAQPDLYADVEHRLTALTAQVALGDQRQTLAGIEQALGSPRPDEREQALNSLHQFAARRDLAPEPAQHARVLLERFSARGTARPPQGDPAAPRKHTVRRIVIAAAVVIAVLMLLGFCNALLY